MFTQILDPTGNLFTTWIVALIPVIALLTLLAGLGVSAWLATLIGSVITFLLGLWVWRMPLGDRVKASKKNQRLTCETISPKSEHSSHGFVERIDAAARGSVALTFTDNWGQRMRAIVYRAGRRHGVEAKRFRQCTVRVMIGAELADSHLIRGRDDTQLA
jgi:hypothetical protein